MSSLKLKRLDRDFAALDAALEILRTAVGRFTPRVVARPKALGLVIEDAPGRAAFRARNAVLGIDAYALHERQIDQQPPSHDEMLK